MGRRGVAAVVAVLFGGVVVGCSPDPAPSPPTPSPTPTWSCTEGTQGPCSEDEAARQKKEIADFAAAEKAYRAFAKEWDRLSQAGGTDRATPAMEANAAGPYLKQITGFLAEQKRIGGTISPGPKIAYVMYEVGVHRSDSPPDELILRVCEDASKSVIRDKSGRKVGFGPVVEGSVYVRFVDTRWKVWDGDTEEVKACAKL